MTTTSELSASAKAFVALLAGKDFANAENYFDDTEASRWAVLAFLSRH